MKNETKKKLKKKPTRKQVLEEIRKKDSWKKEIRNVCNPMSIDDED